ncbi:MAG: porin, partial [Gammaproteobacteria bacterium]|nr:porin [Gammaproteobacteria bacterium]
MNNRFSFPEWAGLVMLCVFSVAGNTEEMTVNVFGRVHIDAAIYDEDVTALGSGTEMRRARLGVSGDIDENWSYRAEYDFAGSSDITDAWIKYSADWGSLTIGNQKPPFSLDFLSSTKFIPFMERAMAPTSFSPGRRIGIGWDRALTNWTFAAMLFGKEANQSINGDQGIGIAGRAAWNTQTDSTLYHVGLAAMWMEPPSTEDDTITFSARPESHVTDEHLVDTTITQARSSTSLGIEFAARWGGLSAQAEFMSVDVDQAAAGIGDPGFNGYYAFVSWFPGGEFRPYKNGTFGRARATRAWEFGIRFSSIDLDDGVFNGGEEKNITLGVNYYVNPQLRFMANYIHADIDNGINGDETPSV